MIDFDTILAQTPVGFPHFDLEMVPVGVQGEGFTDLPMPRCRPGQERCPEREVDIGRRCERPFGHAGQHVVSWNDMRHQVVWGHR